jgi:hypothetical protein
MTSEDRMPQERRLDDERCVDALLAEGGFRDDAELRAVLLQLRELRVTEVPEPSPEVAALLDRPGDADVVSLDDWSRKHPRKKHIVFTTLAVAASLGVAGGAAAGNETLRSQAEGAISGIIRSFSPPAPETPEPTTTAPASPPSLEAPKPAPAVVPSRAETPAAVPAVPAPDEAPTLVPSGREPQDAQAPGRVPRAPHNVGKGAPSTVPQPGGKPADPGSSRPSDMPPLAGEPAVGRADVPADGKVKGKQLGYGRTGPAESERTQRKTPQE